MGKWTPSKPQENTITLSEYDLRELAIIKQAILKSSIEGGVIKKEKIAAGVSGGQKMESDEEFLERWIKWVRRNSEKDRKLFIEQDNAF